jgi:ADP-heptose:LPS heptosyltransferase
VDIDATGELATSEPPAPAAPNGHEPEEGRSAADAEAAQALLARLGDGVGTLLEPDLPRLAATLAAARAYLGGDSGVSHLAAAVGAPSVILFPPATRRRWAPWSPSAVAVEVTGEAREVERVAGEVARRLATSQRRGFISR